MKAEDYRLKFILVGASGSGKTTMAGVLEEQFGLKRCVTSTTRPPREGEVDGISYHFKSEFDLKEMFEHASFGGFEYGVSFDELKKGDFIILEPQGVDYYREHFPNPLTVIQLVREGIEVDADRMARDKAAGFDRVNPDIIVRGETIEEMSENLICAMEGIRKQNVLPREGERMNDFGTKLRDANVRAAAAAMDIHRKEVSTALEH